MKIQTVSVLALVVSLLLLPFTSCIGAKATKEAQFPAAELAWPGVKSDFLRGVDVVAAKGELGDAEAGNLRAEADHLGAALSERDLNALRLVPWSKAMRPLADRGIADQLAHSEVGPTVAAELSERVVNFTATVESLQAIYR